MNRIHKAALTVLEHAIQYLEWYAHSNYTYSHLVACRDAIGTLTEAHKTIGHADQS